MSSLKEAYLQLFRHRDRFGEEIEDYGLDGCVMGFVSKNGVRYWPNARFRKNFPDCDLDTDEGHADSWQDMLQRLELAPDKPSIERWWAQGDAEPLEWLIAKKDEDRSREHLFRMRASRWRYTSAGEPCLLLSLREVPSKDLSEPYVDVAHRSSAPYVEEADIEDADLANLLFEHAPLMMGMVEIQDGDILMLRDNQATSQFYGTRSEDMRRQWSSALGTPAHILRLWIDHYEQSRVRGKPIAFQYRHQQAGEERILAVTVLHLGPSINGRNRYAYIAEDRTEAHRTQEALQRTQTILEDANRIAKIGSWQLDPVQKTCSISREICSIIGCDAENPPGFEKLMRLFHPDDRKQLEHHIAHTQKTGAPYDLELRLQLSNHRMHWVRAVGNAKMMDGVCRYMYGIMQDIDIRKQMELQLEEERRLLRTIIDNIPLNIYVKDRQLRKILLNRSEWEYLGFQNEQEALQAAETNLFDAPSIELFRKEDEAVLQSGIPIKHRTHKVIGADDVPRWFMYSNIPLKSESGAIEGLVGISIDITRRYVAEQQLIRTRQMLEETHRIARVGGWEYDPRSDTLWMSDSAMDILKLQGSHIRRGRRMARAFLHHQADSFIQILRSCLFRRRDLDTEILTMGPEGRTCWLRIMGQPMHTEDGRFRLYGTVQDIDDKKRNELHLHTYKEMFEQSNTGMAIHWLAEDMFEINSKLESWLGYDAQTLHEKARRPGFLSDATKQEALWSQLFAGRPWIGEVQIRNARNERMDLQLHAAPVCNLSGEMIALVFIFTDIRTRKRLEASLKSAKERAIQANKAKSTFLANMSHEIRTPLNSVMGFSDLLSQSDMPPMQKHYVDAIRTSSQNLLELVNDILDFSKIEADKLELAPAWVDLWTLATEVLELVRLRAWERRLELLLYLDPQIPQHIWVDPVRLRQILTNLLSNAIKFTEAGSVELGFQLLEQHDPDGGARLHIYVQDTGIGIHPDKQQVIFEVFAQEDASTTRRFGGTGLGLSICSRLLDLMGSALCLESRPGEGSTFSFTLNTQLASPTNILAPLSYPHLRILIGMAHYRSREIMADYLRHLQVTEFEMLAPSGWAQQMAGGPWDVLIIDDAFAETLGLAAPDLSAYLDNTALCVLQSMQEASSPWAALRGGTDVHVAVKPLHAAQLRAYLERFAPTASSGYPKASPTEPKADMVDATAMAQPDQEVRILIADDQPVNAFLARQMIETVFPRATIFEVEQGKEAIDHTLRNQPDLVLMDIQMPGMTGYEASREIRKRTDIRQPVILALSAHAHTDVQEEVIQAGMDGYLAKPFRLEAFQDLLTRFLDVRSHAACQDTPPEGGSATEAPERHFDRAQLMETLDGSEETFHGLMDMVFHQSLPEIRAQLKAHGHPGGNHHELRNQAHKLKGMARSVCFDRLATLAARLEDLDPFEPQPAHGLIRHIEQEIDFLYTLHQRPTETQI